MKNKIYCISLFSLFATACSMLSPTPDRAVSSLGSDSEVVSASTPVLPDRAMTAPSCGQSGDVAALNKEQVIGGKTYPADTKIYFDDDGKVVTYSDEAPDNPIELGAASDFPCNDITIIPVDPKTGDLSEYNLPSDFKYAGSGHPKKRKHKGKIKHCFRAFKTVFRGRIKLTGEAAASAAAQFRRAGWKRYSYAAAPMGAGCVFGRGGKRTSSGGHIYGHTGVKGKKGLLSVESGFHNHRPFLGCFARR